MEEEPECNGDNSEEEEDENAPAELEVNVSPTLVSPVCV